MTQMMHALTLPTFLVASMRVLRRVTLISLSVVIEHVFYPIFSPDRHPADDRLGSRNVVNIAPLQFIEEILPVHGDDPFFGAKTFATSASKRGSERSGSQTGFTLRRGRAPERSS